MNQFIAEQSLMLQSRLSCHDDTIAHFIDTKVVEGVPGPDLNGDQAIISYYKEHDYKTRLSMTQRLYVSFRHSLVYKVIYMGSLHTPNRALLICKLEQMANLPVPVEKEGGEEIDQSDQIIEKVAAAETLVAMADTGNDIAEPVPVDIVEYSVDKSSSATYSSQASEYVSSTHTQRVGQITMMLRYFKKMYNVTRIVAPSDGAGVCYEASKTLGIECQSGDPTLEMIMEASKRNNRVVKIENKQLVDSTIHAVFISHVEALDPGLTLYVLSLGRPVIVYETHTPFLGMSSLYQVDHQVFSSYPLKLNLPIYIMKPLPIASWVLKAGYYTVHDPRIIHTIDFAACVRTIVICTSSFEVFELCVSKGMDVRFTLNVQGTIICYIDTTPVKGFKYFNIMYGFYHDHPYDCMKVEYEKNSKKYIMNFYFCRQVRNVIHLDDEQWQLTSKPLAIIYKGSQWAFKSNEVGAGQYVRCTTNKVLEYHPDTRKMVPGHEVTTGPMSSYWYSYRDKTFFYCSPMPNNTDLIRVKMVRDDVVKVTTDSIVVNDRPLYKGSYAKAVQLAYVHLYSNVPPELNMTVYPTQIRGKELFSFTPHLKEAYYSGKLYVLSELGKDSTKYDCFKYKIEKVITMPYLSPYRWNK